MTRSWLAGVSAFAMMTGIAFAQGTSDTTISTQTTTSTPAPAVGSFSSSKSQKTIDSTGTEIDKSQSYTSGSKGTDASSSTQTTAPDGSVLSASHLEHTASPGGDTTTTSHTTTTTIEH
jgi:hypothetical protein